MKLSHFARSKNSLEFLWCRYNSILLNSTKLPIIRWKWGIIHLVLYSSGNFTSQTPGFSWGIGSGNSWRFHNWAKTHSLPWSKVSKISLLAGAKSMWSHWSAHSALWLRSVFLRRAKRKCSPSSDYFCLDFCLAFS